MSDEKRNRKSSLPGPLPGPDEPAAGVSPSSAPASQVERTREEREKKRT